MRREPAPALEVHRTTVAGAPALAVRGRLDAGAGPVLEAELEVLTLATEGAVVLDLSGLESLGHANVTVLLRVRAILGRKDRGLAVVCPPGPVRDALDRPPLAQLFAVFDAPGDAARALVPRQTPTVASSDRTGAMPRQPA